MRLLLGQTLNKQVARGQSRTPGFQSAQCIVLKGTSVQHASVPTACLGFSAQYTNIPVYQRTVYQYTSISAHSVQGCQEDTNSVPAHSWRSGELEHSIKVYHLKFVPTQPNLVVQNKQDHSKRKHNAERGRQWRETNRRITSVILEDVQRRDLYGRNVNWIPDIVLYLLTEATGAILGIGW